ncbi:hypothetical protein DXA59_08810 [Clostridium sp. OF03-18AA]|nr:hypothetical protein DXA59_08810 [Clostridium sp. OF03-18AA]
MNVIYRVHGAGGFYMETQSQDQAFRAARQEAAASGQLWYLLPELAGTRCAGSFRTDPWLPGSYKLY